MKKKPRYNIKLIRSKEQITIFDYDDLHGRRFNTKDLIERVFKETDGSFKFNKRNLLWYTEIGILEKAEKTKNDLRIRDYSYRTLFDIYALWIAKKRYSLSIDVLKRNINLELYGMYELIFSLQNLETKMMFEIGLPKISKFIIDLKTGIKGGDSREKNIRKFVTVGEILDMNQELSLLPVKMRKDIPRLHKTLLDDFFKITESGFNPLYIGIKISCEDK